MKIALFILLGFIGFGASAQSVTQRAYCLQGTCKQSINQGDSATLVAQMTTSDLALGSFIWKQTGGPGISFTTATGGVGGTTQSYIGLRPPSNGTYVFTITGTSASGISSSVTDTLVVNAKPVAPAPRTVVSFTITINGQVFTIPVAGAKFTYSDGTTQ